MNTRIRYGVAAFLVLVLAIAASAPIRTESAGADWPSFRGPDAAGFADGFPLPVVWDVQRSRNVRWKTPIQGLGLSSPVVWGGRLFVSTAISSVGHPDLKVGLYGDIASVDDASVHQWIICALDAASGNILWTKAVHTGVPKIKRHPKSTHANSTLATDGRHLVAFLGSEGLYCLDLDGTLIWKKDLGVLDSAFYVAPEAQWEFASSPVIYQDRVLVQCDVLNGSFLAAFALKDGTEIWRTGRQDVPSWSTPTVHASGGRAQVIVNGYRHAGGYDVGTGKEIWRLRGGGDIPVPTPVVAHGLVFLTSAHGPLAPLYAVRLTAAGDISLKTGETSNEFVAWSYPRDGAYMATPLVYGDYVYNLRINGVLSCYSARTGERMYQTRLGGGATGFTASPVAGDGKIYIAGEDGDVFVVKAGPAFELIATNAMGDICMATPALSRGVMFFRTKTHVLAVAVGK